MKKHWRNACGRAPSVTRCRRCSRPFVIVSALAALEASNVAKQVLQLLAVEKERPSFALRLTEKSEPYSIGGLSITLQPDRIDELGNGGTLLIDYKLGDSHSPRQWLDTKPGRPLRPQLPLYGLAHAESLRGLAYVVLAAGAVEYRGWSDGAFIGEGVAAYPGHVRLRPDHPPDWPSLVAHWRKTAHAPGGELRRRSGGGGSAAATGVHLLSFERVLPRQRADAGRRDGASR